MWAVGNTAESELSHPLAGAMFGFGAALCYASLIVMNKFVAGMDGLETTLPQLALATVILAVYVAARRPPPFAVGWQAALLLVFGAVHTAGGSSCSSSASKA